MQIITIVDAIALDNSVMHYSANFWLSNCQNYTYLVHNYALLPMCFIRSVTSSEYRNASDQNHLQLLNHIF